MSLRVRLLLLAAVCVLPAAVLLLTSQWQLRQAREAEVRHELFRLAQSAADRVAGTISGAHQLLNALELSPPIHDKNAPLCSAVLSRLTLEYPSYAAIAADDVFGRAFCSSNPGRASYDGDNAAFRAALEGRRFVVGGFTVSSLVNAPVLPVVNPIIASDNTVLGGVVVYLNLDWLAHDLEERLPTGTELYIADRNGTVLVHSSHAASERETLPSRFKDLINDDTAETADISDAEGNVQIAAHTHVGSRDDSIHVVAVRDRDLAFAPLSKTTRDGIVLIGAALVLALLVAAWMAHRFIQVPIRDLLTTADRLRAGDFATRILRTTGRSELGRLGRALNALASALQHREQARASAEAKLRQFATTLEQRVEERTQELEDAYAQLAVEAEERQRTQIELAQAQKLDALGKLTGGVAHDFNNLLTAILGSLELALKRVSEPRLQQLLTVATKAAERGAKLTSHMLAFSRKKDLDLKPVSANEVIAGMSDLLKRTIGPAIRIRHDLDEQLWTATADTVQLEVALLNLAVNARDAMQDGGELTFVTRNAVVELGGNGTGLRPGDYVVITVKDTGEGMPAEVQANAFEPFFTTKGSGKGTGLGLSMVYGFARQSGGLATIDSTVGEGTAINIYLPRSLVPSTDETCAPVKSTVPMGRLTILLVDDDPDVREATREILMELGHDVSVADSGPAALALLQESSRFDLLIVDFAMPDMSGPQLATRACALHVDLPVLFMTGYVESEELRSWSQRGYRTLNKPFLSSELAAALHDALDLHLNSDA